MNIKEVSVPEIYKTSEDFRFFMRWFAESLTKVQYDTENLPDIYDPLRCPKELLWMLADTMGYRYDDRLPPAFNRAVLVYFMSMIRNRGSKNGMTLAAQVNLKQFDIKTLAADGYENAEGTFVPANPILYDRLEDTSTPVNSVYVNPYVDKGYIEVVYFSEEEPIDACIEYVRPVGMYCFQNPGVRFDGKSQISIDARLTDESDIGVDGLAITHVGHYTREDYASIQKMTGGSTYSSDSGLFADILVVWGDDLTNRPNSISIPVTIAYPFGAQSDSVTTSLTHSYNIVSQNETYPNSSGVTSFEGYPYSRTWRAKLSLRPFVPDSLAPELADIINNRSLQITASSISVSGYTAEVYQVSEYAFVIYLQTTSPSYVRNFNLNEYRRFAQSPNLDTERHPVWYRNSMAEGDPDPRINPGWRALNSLQLCNNEHIVQSLVPIASDRYTDTYTPGYTDKLDSTPEDDLEPRKNIFGLGYGPNDVGVYYPDTDEVRPYSYDDSYVLKDQDITVLRDSKGKLTGLTSPEGLKVGYGERFRIWNLRHDEQEERKDSVDPKDPDVYTVDYERTPEGTVSPRPAVNPIMYTVGDAMSINAENNQYILQADENRTSDLLKDSYSIESTQSGIFMRPVSKIYDVGVADPEAEKQQMEATGPVDNKDNVHMNQETYTDEN